MLKRLCCFIVILFMVVFFNGCTRNANVNVEDGTSSGEMPKTLTIFAPLGSHASNAGVKNNNELLAFQLMEEKTGVHVEWTHPTTGSADEKFNLMIASGNLPDMIVYYWSTVPGGAEMYSKDGIIIPLKDLIERNMPNLKAFNEKRPEVKKQYTKDNGEIYYIPFIRADKELKVFLGPQIRMDWLEKLNLQVPSTTDELYTVLKAFKTQDPNGNGEADEIPMSGVSFENTSFGIGNLLWAFGTHYDFYQSNGKVKYGIFEPEFEEGLKYITKLYSEGLIDIDFLLNDRSKMDAKMINDKVGFLYSFQPTLYYGKMNDGVRRVAGIPHLKGPNGAHNCFVRDYANDVTSVSITVTTANKNPDGSLKWLDEFFGGKGLEYMNFGKEGLTFEWKDGYPTLTDYLLNNPDGHDRISMCAKNIGAYESQFPTLQDWRYYEQTLSPWGREAIIEWSKSADISGILPPLSFTEEENEKIAQIMSQITTFVTENVNKIVIGNESIDKIGYIRERVRSMGIDEVLEIYNNALERYQKR